MMMGSAAGFHWLGATWGPRYWREKTVKKNAREFFSDQTAEGSVRVDRHASLT